MGGRQKGGRIDVSIDLGASRQRAQLGPPANRHAWQRWGAKLQLPQKGLLCYLGSGHRRRGDQPTLRHRVEPQRLPQQRDSQDLRTRGLRRVRGPDRLSERMRAAAPPCLLSLEQVPLRQKYAGRLSPSAVPATASQRPPASCEITLTIPDFRITADIVLAVTPMRRDRQSSTPICSILAGRCRDVKPGEGLRMKTWCTAIVLALGLDGGSTEFF